MLTLLLVAAARAHAPEPAAEAPAQPLVVVNLLGLSTLYAVGLVRLWARSERLRPALLRWGSAFGAALLVTGVALFSPLDPLSDRLAWAHMLQHLLLMMVAAPLFVLASPARVISPWGLPEGLRAPVARLGEGMLRGGLGPYLVWQPLATWALYAATLWIWHLPALYEGALRSPLVHDVQHLAFVLSAMVFWRVVLDPVSRHHLPAGLAVVYLFATSSQAMLLGVLMTLAPRPWYPAYGGGAGGWTLLEDQQIAGAIMWMPGCLLYALVASVGVVAWLSRREA